MRILRIFASHSAADEADRVALRAMTPQERLDQALALQAHYREALGDAGQGFARVALFRLKGVEFLVVGGHAVAYHGHQRLTEDLDLFVRPDPANGERIIAALREFGFGSLELSPADFAAEDRVIQLG